MLLPFRHALLFGALAGASAVAAADSESLAPQERPTPALWERAQLFGEQRSPLTDKGISLGLAYTGEIFGNPTGGKRRGFVYNGLVEPSIDLDLEKLAGWSGLKFHALGYYAHGPSGTKKFVGDLGVYSNIEFYDSPRLFEVWLDQTWQLPGKLGSLSLRAGQLAVDSEFGNAEPAVTFLNSNFGALPTLSLNVPAPLYAIAAPGVRLRWEPTKEFYLQGAVYDGNPDPATFADPSPGARPATRSNRYGVRFDLNSREGALLLFELGYLRNRADDSTGLPGAFRFGFFRHTDTFSDLRRDARGLSLADPASTGLPRARRGNWGIYAVAEQTIWQAPLHAGEARHASNAAVVNSNLPPSTAGNPIRPDIRLFARLGVAPGDRGQAPFYVDAGVNFRGLVSSRPRDILGFAASFTRLSADLRGLARDRNQFAGTLTPLPDYEAVFEATYQFNFAPWLQVQPDLQYIVHPGGSAAIRNALVLGVRTVLTF